MISSIACIVCAAIIVFTPLGRAEELKQAQPYLVTISTDKFHPNLVTVKGEAIEVGNGVDIVPIYIFQKSTPELSKFSLLVTYIGENWIFMNGASFLRGDEITVFSDLRTPDREVFSGNSVYESVVLDIEETFLSSIDSNSTMIMRLATQNYIPDFELKKTFSACLMSFYSRAQKVADSRRPKDIDSILANTEKSNPSTKTTREETLLEEITSSWRVEGEKSTEIFSIRSSSWRISWELEKLDYGTAELMIIIYKADQTLVAVTSNRISNDKDFFDVNQPGEFYLVINTIGTWNISVLPDP